jgi:hypothetical protein
MQMKSPIKDLNRLMARQEFKNDADIQKFMEAFNAGNITLNTMDLTDEEKAQDLVIEAYELSPAKAKKNIDKALALNPNCIEAYVFLAENQETPDKAVTMFDKGIAIGRKLFGGDFLEKNRGHFWGIHETRPFMQCLYQKAFFCLMMKKTDEGINILKEMIELNPNDNQGARYLLFSALAGSPTPDVEYFKSLDKLYADDDSTQVLYPRALFAYKTEGNSAGARKKVIKAYKANPFVIDILLDEDFQPAMSGGYTPGSEEEAEDYLLYGFLTWFSNMDALEWMLDTIEDFEEKEEAKAKKGAKPKDEKGKQIAALTDKFCAEVLKNKEYAKLAQKMIAKLGRKKQVPYTSGKVETWAAAIIHALGSINFLFDKASIPYIKADKISEYFGISKSTVGNKSREVRKLLDLHYWDNEFSTEQMASSNPFAGLMMSNGLIVPK